MESVTKGILNQLRSELSVFDNKGRILFGNSHLQKNIQLSEHQMVGKKVSEFWKPAMNREHYHEMWDTISKKKTIFTGEIQSNRQDSTKKTLNIIPLVDEADCVKYYLQITPSLDLGANRGFSNKIKQCSLNSRSACRDLWNILSYWRQFYTDIHLRESDYQYRQLLTMVESLFYPEGDLNKREDQHIVGFAKKDHRQFSFFYYKYFRYIHAYLAKRMNSAACAEELAHEVFYRAFRRLPDFHLEDCSYLTYLMTIAHNLLVNHYRHFKYALPLEAAYHKGVEPELGERLDQSGLWHYVNQLSETESKVLTLFYKAEMTTEEIGQELGKSANAIKLILSRARKKLKRKLSAFYPH